MKGRIFFTFIVFGFLFTLVTMKAFYIQVINKQKLLSYAQSQFIREESEFPARGNILDRNGSPLAINIHVYNLAINPKKKSLTYRHELKELAKIVPHLNWVKLKSLVEKRKKFTWIARKMALNEKQVQLIKKLKQVQIESLSERVYPNRELMAQSLGFVGIDNNGLAGIEHSLNKQLRGVPHVVKFIRDAKGRPIKFETKDEAKLADDVTLSLDKDVQGALEAYLKEAVDHHKASRGGAGVMDAETGEIIAVANYPSFDPNKSNSFSAESKKLAFVTDPFEPGSIFKTITIAAALEHKVAKPETKFFCENGKMRVQNHWISEAETHERFEWLNVGDILKFSSNVGTTKVAFAVKYPKLKATMDKFKLGHKTGIEVQGESRGIVSYKATDKVKPLSLSNISFGQGIAVTPIQMLRAYGAIANGGYLVNPTLIKNDKSQLIKENRILSEKTAEQLTKMLVNAVNDGTGTNAIIPHYAMAGKTGTAQRVSPRGGYEGYIASFVGFPVNVNRRFVVMAYVDRPTANGYYGNIVAAPIVKKITQYIIYKKKDFNQLAKVETKPALATASDTISTKQAANPKNYAEGLVPDFTGMDKTSALALAQERELQLEFNGFGVVSKQSVPAGSSIQQGMSILLNFDPPSYAE